MDRAFIFGYGSLLRRAEQPGPPVELPCVLDGYRRGWDVAMDNTKDLAGYKFYVDRLTRERPAVFVTFLNIHRHDDARVNGVVFEVTRARLARYDDRERNYERREVGDRLSARFPGPVWAYVGTPAARRRYELAASGGRAVVGRGYYDKVLADFASFGPDVLDEFRRTTLEPAVPARDLVRRPVVAALAP
ncbi:MAG: gamma-glutamylcyclotransferase family protein [Solirubrobacteraceae bacterium]